MDYSSFFFLFPCCNIINVLNVINPDEAELTVNGYIIIVALKKKNLIKLQSNEYQSRGLRVSVTEIELRFGNGLIIQILFLSFCV